MTRVSRLGADGTRASAAFRWSCSRAVEALERRVLLSTYTVSNVNDDGPGSLRQAILDANADSGGDTITFDIPGPAPHVIAPLSPLPVITEPAAIAGRSQPGYSSLTGTPVIELTGGGAGAGADGLVFAPAAGNGSVTGLNINGFAGNGIVLQGSEQSVTGCFVGTDPSGTLAQGNGGNGIVIAGAGDSVTGQTRADRSVISANRMAGVLVTSTIGPTHLSDCFIGVTADGMSPLGNAHEGVLANGPLSLSSVAAPNADWSRNVISGNGYSGIVLRGGTAMTDTITGALLGVNVAGTAAIPNGVAPAAPCRDGITVLGGAATIGQQSTTNASLPNVISGNRGAGVYLGGTGQSNVLGNLIGTDVSGSLPLGNHGDGIVITTSELGLGNNQFSNSTNPLPTAYGGNVIAANGGDGILVLASGVTVRGQYVGVNIVGAPMGNRGSGIEIRGGSQNIIGGGRFETVISANGGAGVSVSGGGTGNLIESCAIGTNVAGNAPLGNAGNGVEVFSSGNTIASNLIGGNGGSGVLLGPAATGPSSHNMVQSNRIGLPGIAQPQVVTAFSAGVPQDMGNAGDGITVISSNSNTLSTNQIYASSFNGIEIIGGANNKVSQNTLSGNEGTGVTVRESTTGAGDAVGNTISQNTFTANGGLPIDLGDDGPTPNDPGDADSGPNELQNYPTIVSATTTGTATTVQFRLDTRPGTYRIEFYTTVSTDVRQGTAGFVAASVIAGVEPAAVYTAILPALPMGKELAATATGTAGTSEFSAPAPVLPPPPQVASAAYVDYNPPHALVFVFYQDVSASLTPAAVILHNVQTGQDFTPSGMKWISPSNVAQFYLPASLPIGDYVATLRASQVTNAFGQHLDGNADGVAGDDYTFRFAYLPGDVNHDHTVNFNDLLVLAGQYGQTVSSASDINGDGTVNFADLLLLAQSYGKSVPAP